MAKKATAEAVEVAPQETSCPKSTSKTTTKTN